MTLINTVLDAKGVTTQGRCRAQVGQDSDDEPPSPKVGESSTDPEAMG